MALISCVNCGNQMSDSASSCPKCGTNVDYNRKTKSFAKKFLLILLVLFSALNVYNVYLLVTPSSFLDEYMFYYLVCVFYYITLIGVCWLTYFMINAKGVIFHILTYMLLLINMGLFVYINLAYTDLKTLDVFAYILYLVEHFAPLLLFIGVAQYKNKNNK